ncbi:MAG: pyruvate, phosphate dikinase [Deltaproteobacteria bacterium]|nr:pyruvate, phosphate dikinase [Deltaproteobacteria bacterium]
MHVYFFGAGKADGTKDDKNLLGGKGAGLAEMTNLGIPVPPGFTITTEVCTHYTQHGGVYPPDLKDDVQEALRRVEDLVGARFGDAANPLLVSVRSGARASMPGMMDTILNLGLNDDTCAGLVARTGDRRFALDAYRRFITMYSDIVLRVGRSRFEEALARRRAAANVQHDHQVPAEALAELVAEYKQIVREATGKPFPTDPAEQLWGAISAVFRSWNNDRAVTYRKMYDIPETWGTAVNVQAMVFGNQGEDCATGVAFTRDPSTGERRFFGEYLPNAQGEDVVAGIRTPLHLTRANGAGSLEERLPEAYASLVAVYQKLEKHFRDMQDIEFTVQRGKLWLLQTRNAKRTARAAVKVAVDMVAEGLIDRDTALLRVDPGTIDQLLHPTLDPKAPRKAIAKGLPASPGAVNGHVVFSAEEAEEEADKGRRVILVRTETSPEDISGMKVARGILTSRGGMTSHAAVVARGMGKCCVAGTTEIDVDEAKGQFTVRGTIVKRGDNITLDGSTGEVFLGEIPTIPATLFDEFKTVLKWADEVRRLKVRANADTPDDARIAREFGAEGIGLCRTEHMFFAPERIAAVREMILSADEAGRRAALAKILPMQREDFVGIFKAMEGLPVTIRLLDPPLHEFLPVEREDLEELAREMKVDYETLRRRRAALAEFNPMLGHRGCRLAITFPEIYEVQTQAIAEAAVEVARAGIKVIPEIMIPLVAVEEEIAKMRELVTRVCDAVFAAAGVRPDYTVGTMIELPRACVVADEIARHADFFSFGTNDLTQTVFGLSRDDAGKFLPAYVERGVLPKDPFVALDRGGVGAMMRIAIERGRKTKPRIKLGICGEHGGEPSSVEFCHEIGLDYVSCSPFRVPVARLVAGQSTVRGTAAISSTA